MTSGAIDLGGTKIEARLFDGAMTTVEMRRVPTPVEEFDSFMTALAGQVGWLIERADAPHLPIGIGLPGLIDPDTGLSFASNVPISGRNVRAALAERLGRDFVLGNDCMSFAYSEAHGGAADGEAGVVGLILGTGLGAGFCLDGRVPRRRNGLAVEIGHVGMPARALSRFGLPEWRCGCGKSGCMERYVSGSGLAALAAHRLGRPATALEIVERAGAGEAAAEAVLTLWAELTAECLLTLQLVLDPDCIVLGGGLSKMPDILARLEPPLAGLVLGRTRPPALRLARHGDSSGARGMALLAREAQGGFSNFAGLSEGGSLA
ncbi:N-acetyl-D-glucosamine kinase [Aureimonas endophytica]|uniref:N-acetylglucosamine kinase n=1 Tax=Aureimonas endophytica TaxID=2027858 RepID=A0A917E2R7_9HYPH|nr:ROK family protein [Aureimonas endophytica]GGD95513.1 N-acetyl-D-glucosamine kinase [Aureimonas endophytica]